MELLNVNYHHLYLVVVGDGGNCCGNVPNHGNTDNTLYSYPYLVLMCSQVVIGHNEVWYDLSDHN